MIFINLQLNYILKVFVMGHSNQNKKKKKSKGSFYFLAITAITAAAFFYIVKEGQRVKIENELLAYEVW
jgi:hypothetical protein